MPTGSSTPPLREAALALAAEGWAVFPVHSVRDGKCTCNRASCEHPGKHPATPHGFYDATRDPEVIRRIWTEYPDANIGGRCGAASGRIVLDVDCHRPEEDGRESVRKLEAEHGELPETVESITGSLGRHVVYRHAGGVTGIKGFVPGCDLQAEGSYVILPPSRHASGRTYLWELAHTPEETPLADAPEWLLAIATKPNGKPPGNSAGPVKPAPPIPETIPEGKRDSTLTSLAGSMRRRAAEAPEILAALREVNKRCKPPLDNAALQKIAAGVAGRYAPAPETTAADRPEIRITTEIAQVVDAAQAALLALPDVGIFQRGGLLVRIVRDGGPKVTGLTRPSSAPIITTLPDARLLERLAAAVRWRKSDARSGGKWKPALPPSWAVEVLQARGEWPFPTLEGVIETPTFRPDGSILSTPGYDERTGLLYEAAGCCLPEIVEEPDQEDARAALDALIKPFEEFPFLGDSDRSALVAADLTIQHRHAIDGPTPLFIFRAPTPGSGKGLLADCISIIATGRNAAIMTPPKDDNEDRKRILTIAIEAAPVVLLDNVEGVFGSEILSAALTARDWKDRLLCVNRTVTAPLRTVWLLTGNNVTFRGDLGRRVVPIDIDPKVEHPEDRTGFRHPDLRAYVTENRGQLVAAGLTILRAFHLAGRPGHGLPAKGSFEAWDALIRGAIIWAGSADPLGTSDRLRAEGDADLDSLRNGLAAWFVAFGMEAVTAGDAVAEARERARRQVSPEPSLENALADLASCPVAKLDSRRLGYALRSRAGRIASGLRFEKDQGNTAGSTRWKVVRT